MPPPIRRCQGCGEMRELRWSNFYNDAVCRQCMQAAQDGADRQLGRAKSSRPGARSRSLKPGDRK